VDVIGADHDDTDRGVLTARPTSHAHANGCPTDDHRPA